MTDHIVNSISGRLSLRKPQRESLEILGRVTEIMPPAKETDIQSALDILKKEYPCVQDFEREFPSLCFSLATGVGKTRLMGAFISYLHLKHKVCNFFVLAPNLTIYNKLIADFTPNTPKYVFKGINEFAIDSPLVITGETYESNQSVRSGKLFDTSVHINIFNISKINSEVRGGKSPRIKRLSEYIGQSYFDYLSSLPDLVLIMDESHRYRASAGVKAINELKPILGLELTATPFIEAGNTQIPFKNVIYDFPLALAMDNGFVKEPAVVTQKNFKPADHTESQLEIIKLEDGIRVHETVKVELEAYARNNDVKIVKPFILVIAKDTTHAASLLSFISSDKFFDGRYAHKVIQVDSSTKEDELIERLLKVEDPQEPTEIVIHVNMLKEGWDVTNLYTIIPLRAANARTLVEQSIGRGLRLPYGKRTGNKTVDRLNIIAHDKFQEIVDEANKPDSPIRLTQLILDPADNGSVQRSVVISSTLEDELGLASNQSAEKSSAGVVKPKPIFETEREIKIAAAVHTALQNMQRLPSSKELLKKDIQKQIVITVQETMEDYQENLPGVESGPDIADIVSKVTNLVVERTIDIPRIIIVPKGEVTSGFHEFTLDCSSINYQPVNHELLIQHLRTHEQESLSSGNVKAEEQRLENYIVRNLMNYGDISYDDHSEILNSLSSQCVAHLKKYLSFEDCRDVLIYHQKQLADFIHAQMVQHQWEKVSEYDVKVSKGFTTFKSSVVTVKEGQTPFNFRLPVAEKSKMSQMLFTGFAKGLYSVEKFDSDTERRCAVILDRDAEKWFKPKKGQFQIYYKAGTEHQEYIPDFVAEMQDCILLIETKAANEMTSPDVLAKKDAASKWCAHATTHTSQHQGKPWKYLLIPHDSVAENMTLEGLMKQYGV